MNVNVRNVVFSAVMAVVCAGLLTAAHELLAERQQANAEAYRLRNVFSVLDVTVPDGADSRTLVALAKDKLTERTLPEAELTWYEYTHPQAGTLRAFAFSGPGLWGPVYGLVCVKEDLRTIYGISFYKHEETAGLGGVIGEEKFTKPFSGLTVGPGQSLRVGNRRGGDDDPRVDAISGATMTGDRVERMVNAIMKRIAESESAIRKAGQ